MAKKKTDATLAPDPDLDTIESVDIVNDEGHRATVTKAGLPHWESLGYREDDGA